MHGNPSRELKATEVSRDVSLVSLESERQALIGRVVRVASGNFLEMYDFIVYGYYASYIAATFFPSDSQFASLMLSLMTFGAGYLMRPLGAIVLGAYIDRRGRRAGLILTLGLMAIGTLTIAATPGYATLGVVAPLMVLVGRLLQGLSAGVELGGVSIYLAEIATPGHRGFYCAWQSASQQVAVVFTALLGIALAMVVPPTSVQMTVWGWRVPLFVGCLIIPLVLYLRRSLEETEAFRASRHVNSSGEVFSLLAGNWQVILLGTMLSVLTTTTFYLITAYTPTFGRQALRLAPTGTLIVTLLVGVSNFSWVPIGGALSDRIGRRPLLVVIPVLALVTAYPAMAWLVAAPTLSKLLIVLLWFSLCFGLYNGAMIPFLAEMMPPEVRTAGFSLAFSLATAVFGGFTPAISTYLIEATGNRASPALWLSAAAAISLTAASVARARWTGSSSGPAREPAVPTAPGVETASRNG
jgi:MFS family permease